MAKPGDKSAQEADLKAREKALSEKEEALEYDLKKLNMVRSGLRDFEATKATAGSPFMLSEIHDQRMVEGVEGEDFKDAVALEAFMNELILIHVYTDGTSGALEVVTPTVNGVNQPIIRGRDQLVKRKYIEVLARSKIITYRQEVADQSRPENIQMTPLANMTTPFVVREDKNPRGRAWLEHILAQPV
jgi:hypothetical protein